MTTTMSGPFSICARSSLTMVTVWSSLIWNMTGSFTWMPILPETCFETWAKSFADRESCWVCKITHLLIFAWKEIRDRVENKIYLFVPFSSYKTNRLNHWIVNGRSAPIRAPQCFLATAEHQSLRVHYSCLEKYGLFSQAKSPIRQNLTSHFIGVDLFHEGSNDLNATLRVHLCFIGQVGHHAAVISHPVGQTGQVAKFRD